MTDLRALADPRLFPDPLSASPGHGRLYALAAESLAADSRQRADALDGKIRDEIARLLAGEGAALAALIEGSPSVAVSRHLWRALDVAWQEGRAGKEAALAIALFALPVVIVTGVEAATGEVAHSGVLRDPDALAAILREHGALGGSRTFALSNALAGVESLELARLPDLYAWQRLSDREGAEWAPRALAPSSLRFPAGREGVHLRFVVGSAVARPGVDLLADPTVGKWGVPFTKAFSRELAVAGTSVLALPRAPQRPLLAVRSGRAAQRDVGAQIFASNAIRKLRASAGEPSAVISAHRAPDAPGGGELRLSLSSPFASPGFHEPGAEGFRCPIFPLDRVDDVARMLVDLMTDCRVTDVRIAAGVHADRDPATGLTLLFKPETLPDVAGVQ
jgi:hypothetical protein